MTALRKLSTMFLAPTLAMAVPSHADENGGENGPCSGAGAGEECEERGASDFTFTEIQVEQEDRRGVFVAQVGSSNRAEARQNNSSSYVRIAQNGDENQADVDQAGGEHLVQLAQDGDRNTARIVQDGQGQSVLMLAQQGNGHQANISQTEAGSLFSAAAISQSGAGNLLNLVQDGSDNQARLTQTGEDNAMSATQLGAGNRLEWTQDGNGLSDLQITQDGGQAMQVTQTNTGSPAPGGG